MPIRSGFGRLPKLARETLIALAFVSATVAVAAALLTLFGDRRLGMVFLLPVLFAGVTSGVRAAMIAAAVSFSIFNFFLVEPIFTLQIASPEDALTLVTFVVAAVLTGVASGALRDEGARAFTRARILRTISNASRYFLSTADEAGVRARLASAISEIVGAEAAVTDAEGRLTFRAGRADRWTEDTEAELSRLVRDVADRAGRTLTLGNYRVRTALMNERVFGAAVWMQPGGRYSRVIETDHYVGMLIELANAAIVRCRRADSARLELLARPGAGAQ